MVTKMGILDLLAKRMGCGCLSDLHYLPENERLRMADEIERIPALEYPLREWSDALEYITGNGPERTSMLAKNRLIESLRTEG